MRQCFTAQDRRERSRPFPSYLFEPPQSTNRSQIGMGQAWFSGTLEASASVQGQSIGFSRQKRMASKPAAALGAAGGPSQHQCLSDDPSATASAIRQNAGRAKAAVNTRAIGSAPANGSAGFSLFANHWSVESLSMTSRWSVARLAKRVGAKMLIRAIIYAISVVQSISQRPASLNRRPFITPPSSINTSSPLALNLAGGHIFGA